MIWVGKDFIWDDVLAAIWVVVEFIPDEEGGMEEGNLFEDEGCRIFHVLYS